jgi:putative ABC transport system permease protein
MKALLRQLLGPSGLKVLRDLWWDRKRTLIVVLSLAVSVFTIGTVIQLRMTMSRDMEATYASVNPASAIIYTASHFDSDLVTALRRMPELADVDGRQSIFTRFRLAPNGEWHPIELIAIPDYADIRVGKVQPEHSYEVDPDAWPNPDIWPPPRKTLLLERTSLLPAMLGLTQTRQDDVMTVETPSGRTRDLRIAGLTRDFGRLPASNAGRAYGYITMGCAEWLEVSRDFNELHIVVAADRANKAHITAVVEKIRRRLERMGIDVVRVEVPEPGRLPLDFQFQAITLLLGQLGLLALVMSCFLIVNMVQAIMARQIREIGIMKALGGHTTQISRIYLGMIFLLGVLALLIAVPLGAYVANGSVRFMAYFINFHRDVSRSDFHLPFSALLAYLVAGMLAPMLVSLHPIMVGSRIPVRQALRSHGLSGDWFEFGCLDRFLERFRHVSPAFLVAMRNVLRQKKGLLYPLIPLTLASAIVIAVFSVQTSLRLTLDDALRFWQFDLQLRTAHPYHVSQVEEAVLQAPGVSTAESWGAAGAYRKRPDGSESDSIYIMAPPARSEILQPTLLQGRWLLAEDDNALVVNVEFLKKEPDAQVGEEIVLNIKGRDTSWIIVGVVQMQMSGSGMMAFANYPYLARAVSEVGKARTLQVLMTQQDAASQAAIADDVQARLKAMGVDIAGSLTVAQLRVGSEVYFGIVMTFLLSMAILLAIVGGLGLMGAVSLKVIERKREIGVLRAIGATDGAILGIFLTEGISLGIMSWLLGALLAFPLSRLVAESVGMQLLGAALGHTYSMNGTAIWLLATIGLAALATYGPAKDATLISVHEALKYE